MLDIKAGEEMMRRIWIDAVDKRIETERKWLETYKALEDTAFYKLVESQLELSVLDRAVLGVMKDG